MLLGITGPARHGKNTVADMLMPYLNNHNQFAFAAPIKAFLQFAFDAKESMAENKDGVQEFYTDEELLILGIKSTFGDALKHFCISEEYALTTLLGVLKELDVKPTGGTHGVMFINTSWRELMQVVGTEWGRNKLHPDFWIDTWMPYGNTVITDVRRNNEAGAIIKEGGMVIRVEDPRKGEVVRKHVSESGIGDHYITTTIINDGSLEDLKDKVHSFVYCYLLSGEC